MTFCIVGAGGTGCTSDTAVWKLSTCRPTMFCPVDKCSVVSSELTAQRRQALRSCFGRGAFPACLDAVDQLLHGGGPVSWYFAASWSAVLLSGGQAGSPLRVRVEESVVDRLGVQSRPSRTSEVLDHVRAAWAANVHDWGRIWRGVELGDEIELVRDGCVEHAKSPCARQLRH